MEGISPKEAERQLRTSITDAMQVLQTPLSIHAAGQVLAGGYHAELPPHDGAWVLLQVFQAEHGCRPFGELLDMGCSVGVSARWMAKTWPEATITGLDLSPYFLAVAEHEERYSSQPSPHALQHAGSAHAMGLGACSGI